MEQDLLMPHSLLGYEIFLILLAVTFNEQNYNPVDDSAVNLLSPLPSIVLGESALSVMLLFIYWLKDTCTARHQTVILYCNSDKKRFNQSSYILLSCLYDVRRKLGSFFSFPPQLVYMKDLSAFLKVLCFLRALCTC